uniref:PAP/OAS1 substrate-binding-related domain-containing protein n=1 Tax=Hyaloperonospora arabidopsidis (strain Emoy2) TaxID=559515 RepID=M4BBQ8_HYAAE
MKIDKLPQPFVASNNKSKKKKGKNKRREDEDEARTRDETFDDVDKRIQIPVVTRMKMQMNLKMNASSSTSATDDTRLLRSGIDKYRSLQHLNNTVSSSPSSTSDVTRSRRSHGSGEWSVERGMSLMEKKQYAAAIPYFTEALDLVTATLTPDRAIPCSAVKLYHQRGLCFLASHKYKAAIEDLSQVMHMTPKSAELYAKRGKAYSALGEYHAALLDYSEAINLAATQGLLHDRGSLLTYTSDGLASSSASLVQLRGLYMARAKVYKAMNNITHALEDLSRAENVAGGHRDLELFYERAFLYLLCHQEPLALLDFDRFLELQKEAEEGRHFDASGGVGGLAGFVAADAEPKARVLNVLLERAKLQQVMAVEAHARERKDAEVAAVEQGQAMLSRSRKGGKSVVAYATSIAVKPEPYCGMESRRLEKRALRDFSRALELDSRDVDTWRLRGECLMHLGRYEDALADFKKALELEPHDFQVRMARATLFRQRGDLKRAVEEVTAVLDVNGFFIDGLNLRAHLYEELGATKEAETDYSSIIYAHFDKPESGHAVSSGKITLELASGGTLKLGNHGGKSGKNAKEGASGRIMSEVAAQALLSRARLRLATEQFDEAEEDYQAILKSFANNMEAQLELQVTRERKVAFEERKQREALVWLEENADDVGSVGGNGNGHITSGKNKKKKKRKKKKASTSCAGDAGTNWKPPTGYVLLEDDEELLQQQEIEIEQEVGHEKSGQKLCSSQSPSSEMEAVEKKKYSVLGDAQGLEEESKNGPGVTMVDDDTSCRQGPGSMATTLSEEILLPETTDDVPLPKPAAQSSQIIAERDGDITEAAPTLPPVVVASVMTRDEAWDSMWDEESDEPLEAGSVRIRIPAQVGSVAGDQAQIGIETMSIDAPSKGQKGVTLVTDSDLKSDTVDPIGSIADDEITNEASGSSDDGKDSQGKAKAVLVDEKYLRKREKQLKKLRTSLQYASNERDKCAIDDALARAERKQMSDALQDDIQRARNVLADIAVEAQRSSETLPCPKPILGPTSVAECGRKHLHTVKPTSSGVTGSSGGSPSLVIRPIAYGQALQAAEQHQQQLRAQQKLIEEKDAEIARLKTLLAQKEQAEKANSPQEESRRAMTGAKPEATALAHRASRLRAQFPVQGAAARQAEVLIEWMGPSDAADRVRQQVLSFVQHVITAHFPLAPSPLFFATGSYPMKTYLPGSDLDVCLLVPRELESSWYYIVTQALCVAGSSGGVGTVVDIGNVGCAMDGGSSNLPPRFGSNVVGSGSGPVLLTNTVRNVAFVNADVRVVKCTVDNISVDFTANRVGALGAVRLLDAMAVRVGRHHLFKKSLILIKAWCTHESSPFLQAASSEICEFGSSVVTSLTPSSVMGASQGALSTYAVNTIVMALFNQHGDALTHPLQALYLFLDRLAEFPWHESALTLYGAVPLNRLATTPLNGFFRPKSKQSSVMLDADDVEALRDALANQFGAFDAALNGSKGTPSGLFPIRACNIVDPLDDKNNLARSVSAEGFPVVKRAFRLARDQLVAMLTPQSSRNEDDAEETSGDVGTAFFARCWQLYGRGDGWRPDLLIHPRQVWHGKAAFTSGSGSKKVNGPSRPRASSASLVDSDEDEERRWESLLPSLDVGAANALLVQHQQLQAAAATAYHHGSMIVHQQPYYGPSASSPEAGPTELSTSTTIANGSAGSVSSGAAELAPQYSPLRRPCGSPGSNSQRGKSPPPKRDIGRAEHVHGRSIVGAHVR